MEKKIQDILQAFQHYRFEDALRQIDQLIKKVAKDAKKKNNLSQNDNRTIQMVKCGCLASIGRIHEANSIIQNYFNQKILSQMSDKEKFMFISIAQLAYDQNIIKKVQLLNKTGKGDVRLQRFMLSHRLFSSVSKSFLKQYATQKRQQDGLAQIFLQYVNQLNKIKPIEDYYSRDLIIETDKQLNLKMVELFFMKYFTGVDLNKLQNVKLRSSIIDLRIRLAINSGKTQQAKKYYLQHFDHIQQHFVYLRSIRQMKQNQNQNHRFYIENCGVIFRKNLEIQKYVPLYDYYDQFLDFITTQSITKDFLSVKQTLQKNQQLTQDKLYNFKQISNDKILTHYFQSLFTELKALTSGQKCQLSKKSDYYKISIKGLMLQLLKIHHLTAAKVLSCQQSQSYLLKNKQFNWILQNYFDHFAKTLTYPNQIKNYRLYLRDKLNKILQNSTAQKNLLKLPENYNKSDDNLILFINTVKMVVVENKDKLYEWKQCQKWVDLCWNSYKQFIEEVEQSKRRQKGQVFLSDQFISLLSDILIYHIQNLSNLQSIQTQTFIQSVLIKLMEILDYATEVSPFNGYLKLRLLYVCHKLNYIDKLIDTYFSLDIKSVQYQTLGYFLINPLNSFNLYAQSQERLTKMVRSYQQNQRETSQYCLKGLKAGTTNQVFEYFSYQKRIQKSYSKMMLFYSLYMKYHRKQHSEFYLKWIDRNLNEFRKTNKKINYNCDTKTMQNMLINLDNKESNGQIGMYNEYYGYLNNGEVFSFQIKLRTVESLLRLLSENMKPQYEKDLQNELLLVQKQFSKISKQLKLQQLYKVDNNFDLIGNYLNNKNNQAHSNQHTEEHKQSKITFTLYKIIKDLQFYLKISTLKISFFKFLHVIINLIKLTQNNEQMINQVKQKYKQVLIQIQQCVDQLNNKMLWRQQVKNTWLFRQTLFTINHLLRAYNEQVNKIKKIVKPVKNTIGQFSSEIQKIVLNGVTNIKFSPNLKIESCLLNIGIQAQYVKKIQQRDQIIRRTTYMDNKQAKNYILK